jgi:hypothetical protein
MPITPGVYKVANEGQNPDDSCMLSSSNALALVDVLLFPNEGGLTEMLVATSVSGTVTLTSVNSGAVSGSFDVELLAAQGSATSALSGIFVATPCEAPGI